MGYSWPVVRIREPVGGRGTPGLLLQGKGTGVEGAAGLFRQREYGNYVQLKLHVNGTTVSRPLGASHPMDCRG